MRTSYAISLIALVVTAAAAGGYWFGHSQSATPQQTVHPQRSVLYWYDPMVPATRFDKPGKSPFMDMELVPRYADEQPQDGVQISPRQQQNLGVRTAPATRRHLEATISAFASVAADERAIVTIPARANGQVEKLYVSAAQQWVKRGEPLAQLWVPEWHGALQEYLAVSALGDRALTAAARARLALQFIPQEIIRESERQGQPRTRVTLRATQDGYIRQLNIRVGAQVSAGQALFELVALDPVWIVMDYPESQANRVAVGSAVDATTRSWPGQVFSGKVSELLPDLDPNTRTLKARVVLDNPRQQLKPGMFLTVTLHQPTAAPVLTIPEEALITTARGSRVLLTDGNGMFTPVSVKTGAFAGDLVEITDGLDEGQRVVTSGQFLIDSEANLRSALPQMAGSETAVSYHSRGVIKAIKSDIVTINHEPIPELKWGAMTMDFSIDPAQGAPFKPGVSVMFSFSLNDDGARVTDITPVNNPAPVSHKEHL